MLKIVVFDGGCGGETVAEYLAEELQIAEIIQVVDRRNASYAQKSVEQVRQLTEEAIAAYIGKVDLIVLGGYKVSMALDYLKTQYGDQKFVGVGVNYCRILKSRIYPKRVTVIMNEQLVKTDFCRELHNNLPSSILTIPDSTGWEELADNDELSVEKLRTYLGERFELKPKTNRELARERAQLKKESIASKILKEKYTSSPNVQSQHEDNNNDTRLIKSDVVLILNTHYWKIRDEIEAVFGYRAQVIDFRQKLLHDVCVILDLPGARENRRR